jgi:hypothetical protein
MTIFLQLFQLIGIGSANKKSIHIKDLPLRIHQKLSVITFNLYPSHYNVILHVHAHLLISIVRIIHYVAV